MDLPAPSTSSRTWQIAHPPHWASKILSTSSRPIPQARSRHAAREQGLHQQARPSGRLRSVENQDGSRRVRQRGQCLVGGVFLSYCHT